MRKPKRMTVREFTSMASLLRKAIYDRVVRQVGESRQLGYDLRTELDRKLREVAVEAVKSGRVDLSKAFGIEVIWDYHTDKPRGISFTVPFDYSVDPEIVELSKKYRKTTEKYKELKDLLHSWSTIFNTWKVRALGTGKRNLEPFPRKLWPFVPDELKDLLVVEEDGGERR